MGVEDASKESKHRQDNSPPNPFVALFLFCVTHFVFVSALFLVVFHQVSASIANPPREYWLTDHPQLWDLVFGTWRALSSPTYLFDVYGAWLGMNPRSWSDPIRSLLHCFFCGCFWGCVSYSVYWCCNLLLWRLTRPVAEEKPVESESFDPLPTKA